MTFEKFVVVLSVTETVMAGRESRRKNVVAGNGEEVEFGFDLSRWR